jgi:glycosyltransferase involved in cell wall biosynthesis
LKSLDQHNIKENSDWKFSVLMSVFHTEKPKILDRALRSVWDDQFLKPNEIVLVKDGPLTSDLNEIIKVWSIRLGNDMKVISLKKNIGLGDALGLGIIECSFDIVARMDTDDISLPYRFSTQIDFFKKNQEIQILGAHISEFKSNENSIISTRFVPLTHEKIFKSAKFNNPFNHPVVMYRKSAILKVGGPTNFTGFDDYFLWIKVLMKGYKCANIDNVLLLMRTGNGLVNRRSGIRYAIQELNFQNKLYEMGFINIYCYLRNFCLRVPIRLFPTAVIKIVYKYLLRT